jgi:anion-transporting  ArsA/GET3 family ATPase
MLRFSIVGEPSGGYSHGEQGFLHDNYDRGVSTRKRRTLQRRLEGKRICVCLGAGGVGKTTTSAALALGLAAAGQKVAVVTIDPAERLAAALGLRELSGEPRLIDPEAFAAQGVAMKGELWAMMLDPKRTLDEVVGELAPGEHAREDILTNPIYRELSSAVAGSQELSAITKLYELDHEHDFDVIVLDTPPSRNALDFLEAPTRLLGFMEGRALKVFVAPGGPTARLFGRSTSVVFAIFARVSGVDLLGDLSRFFRSLSGVIEGFRERTHRVAALLRGPQTTFVIVSSPEPEPARESIFLAGRLAAVGMPRGALIVNRVHSNGLGGVAVAQVATQLAGKLGGPLASRVASNLGDFDVLVQRDRDTIAQLSHELGETEPILVPQLDEDVQDLAGLSLLAGHLFA